MRTIMLMIVCLGILLYAGTLFDTFHFDDFTYIVGNTAITDPWNIQAVWQYYPCRFLTFLSFALNYRFNGLDVLGYHLFNIAAHLVCALLASRLVLLTFAAPVMQKDKVSRHAKLIALFAGLVFVSHPLQIETLNYISQRSGLLATLFYLLSLYLYAKSRLVDAAIEAKSGDFLYDCSLLSAVAAMFCKEIAVTLPLIIVLYEYFFLPARSRRADRLRPFLFFLAVIPLTMLLTRSKLFHEVQSIAQGQGGISPWHYLLTQMRVMVTYIRLAFLPFNQNLDYDYPVFKSFWAWPVLLSFLFLAAIVWAAVRLLPKYRLVSFGIFWFFITLLPESSLLPFQDVIYEHRLYLPLAGFSIFLAGSVFYLLQNKGLRRPVTTLAVIIACFCLLTYQRNKVWKNEFTLWNDTLQKSPRKARPYMSRGSEYLQQGRYDLALADYNRALELDPNYVDVLNDRASIYAHEGMLAQAIDDCSRAIAVSPWREEAYFNRGSFYQQQGDQLRAIFDFSSAISLNPQRAETFDRRGASYIKEGSYSLALADFNRAIAIDPRQPQAYNNRGAVYATQGDMDDAIREFNRAIALDPDFDEAYKNLDAAYAKAGTSSHE